MRSFEYLSIDAYGARNLYPLLFEHLSSLCRRAICSFMQPEFRSFKDLALSRGMSTEEESTTQSPGLPTINAPGRYTSSDLLEFLRDRYAPDIVALCPTTVSSVLSDEFVLQTRELANAVFAVSRSGGKMNVSGFEDKAVKMMTSLNPKLQIAPEPKLFNVVFSIEHHPFDVALNLRRAMEVSENAGHLFVAALEMTQSYTGLECADPLSFNCYTLAEQIRQGAAFFKGFLE